MKIVYAGTPEFAVPPLDSLIRAGFAPVAVITQEDKPQGRKGILTPSPVKFFALEHGISVVQPKKIREETETLKSLGGDLLVTCAYGQILSQETLDAFPLGVWNIHAGLLPDYRGASPIQSCIVSGETRTGVSIMKTELGLDTGAVLCAETLEIGEETTYGELSARLSELAAKMLPDAIERIASGKYALIPQAEKEVKITRKIGKEQAKLDFSRTAKEIVNLVRGYNPEPVAYTGAAGVRLNVWKATAAELPEGAENAAFGEVLSDLPKKGLLVRCKDGAVRLSEVQLAGGKRMKDGDFLNGKKVEKGQILYVE